MISKAEALAAAKKRIIELQAQMTSRILAMAAEIEKLAEVTTAKEAREFLRVSCNLPSLELSTYFRFKKTLKGQEELLTKARVSFPVLKALVASDDEARKEVLGRMSCGARIDTKEIAEIRKQLTRAKLTPRQVIAERNAKLMAAVARKKVKVGEAVFREKLDAFVNSIWNTSYIRDLDCDSVRAAAADLKADFEVLFGADHPEPEALEARSGPYFLAKAYEALRHLESGLLSHPDRSLGRAPYRIHPGLLALQSLTDGEPGDRLRTRPLYKSAPAYNRPRVLEVCAGAGGMAIGFERAGFEHVALVEYDRNAAATLRLNRPDWNVIEKDMRLVDFKVYRDQEVDLVAGGIPCQPYSSDGYGLGKEDPRDLLLESVRAVDEIRPRAFVFENVDGLLHAAHADHLANALRGYRKAGFEVEIHRMQAEDYGVAQERSRVLIIGWQREFASAFRMPPRFPERKANLGDVLVDLMAANGWTGAYEWARQRREQEIVGRDGTVIRRGVTASTIVTRRGTPREKEALRWAAKGINIGGLPDHAPTELEASQPGFLPQMTARMRARLQDFPDSWLFSGKKQSTADQIGNAVPSTMAAAIGLAVYSAIRAVDFDWEAVLWPEDQARQSVSAPPLVSLDLRSIGRVDEVPAAFADVA